MKNLLVCTIITLLLCLNHQDCKAQVVSLTANMYTFGFENFDVDTDDMDVSFDTKSNISGNLRLYTRKRWALRLGGGIDRFEYTVGGPSIGEQYDAQRRDVKGLVGLEKHFQLGSSLTFYPGVLIPITVVGDDDIVSSNLEDIQNGHTRAGLGLVLGANYALLNLLRVGFEVNYNYNNFQNDVWRNQNQLQSVNLSGMDFESALTIGIAF